MKNTLSAAIVIFPIALFLILFFVYPEISDTVLGISFKNYSQKKDEIQKMRDEYNKNSSKESSQKPVEKKSFIDKLEKGADASKQAIQNSINTTASEVKQIVNDTYNKAVAEIREEKQRTAQTIEEQKNAIKKEAMNQHVTDEQLSKAEDFLKNSTIL